MVTEEKGGGDFSDHERNESGSLETICIESKGDVNENGKMSPADEAKPVSGERRENLEFWESSETFPEFVTSVQMCLTLFCSGPPQKRFPEV